MKDLDIRLGDEVPGFVKHVATLQEQHTTLKKPEWPGVGVH